MRRYRRSGLLFCRRACRDLPGTHRSENGMPQNEKWADTEKKKAKERGIERDERGMAEKFLERRKEPGKMNSVSLQRGERERLNKRAGLPGTGSRGIMIILGVGKE